MVGDFTTTDVAIIGGLAVVLIWVACKLAGLI